MSDVQASANLISVGAQAIVDQAQTLGLSWTLRPATVASSTRDRITVVFDGDTVAINATNMTGELLLGGARVYCIMVPQTGNFIVGQVGMVQTIGAVATRSLSALGIADATPTPIEWDTSSFDSSGFIGTLPLTDLIIPEGLGGIYAVTVGVNITASGTRNFVTIFVNGIRFVRFSFDPGEDYVGGCGTRFLASGDTVSADAFQNSGGSGALIGDMWLYRVG
jgi:hypothetical protein